MDDNDLEYDGVFNPFKLALFEILQKYKSQKIISDVETFKRELYIFLINYKEYIFRIKYNGITYDKKNHIILYIILLIGIVIKLMIHLMIQIQIKVIMF